MEDYDVINKITPEISLEESEEKKEEDDEKEKR